ncbi:hypothetical protein QJS10_CPB20g01794 [Acorus calamus]|uniref:Uncharacterized protein n=1 Tax=Acorus calamus TaxID=4465 RepID=A0AAV9CBQ7_ACOCL|nr:hypothetical protein QJS10_CPB20g01794 [Acorus calamus]
MASTEATSMEEDKIALPKPRFEPLKAHEMSEGEVQFRKVNVPAHRFTPLKKSWMEIYTPVYEQMKVDIRMNLKSRKVEMKTRPDTPDVGNLQKCADFVHASCLDSIPWTPLPFYVSTTYTLRRLKSRTSRPCVASTCPEPSDGYLAKAGRRNSQSRTPRGLGL